MIKILNEISSQNLKDEQEIETNKMSARTEIDEKVKMIRGKTGEELKETIKRMYPMVFKGLGKIEPNHQFNLKENAVPVIHASRKTPASLRDKVKKELESMEAAGVIRPIDERTVWVNSMVVVEK